MRHLMEVMLVVEGKEGWARRLAEERREQGLPLPSVELLETGNKRSRMSSNSSSSSSSSNSSSSNSSSIDVGALVKGVVETVEAEAKKLGKLVVSFI